MTHDDSVQIAATSPARRRAVTRIRRGERASGRDAVVDVVASGPGRTPVAREVGSAARSRGNFPPCKALKTHKMRKESRFCASPFYGPAEHLAPRRKARQAGSGAREPGVLDPARASEETPARSSIF